MTCEFSRWTKLFARGAMRQDELDLLIIEDDVEILVLLRELFTDHGFRLATADSVTKAREALSHSVFKIVLSDHNLPDGNGVDFLVELRALGIRSIPILMTGLMDLNVAVEAINRGSVYRFVTKPLDLAALNMTIRRAAEYYDSLRDQERLTREVVEQNKRLHCLAQDSERVLQRAEDRIRAKDATVEQQKAHIETLYSELEEAYLRTIASLTIAIEAKDQYTKGHSERVSHYCALIADVLGLPEVGRRNLHHASMLHDLGKIGVPDQVLNKPGPLTPEEHHVMAAHVGFTDQILKPLPFLGVVRRIIREHHERFDGNGYPEGLKGDSISLEGRIIAIADAFDAMRSHRAYRRALSHEQALDQIKKGAGTQFCPLCSGAFGLAMESMAGQETPKSAPQPDTSPIEDYLALRHAADPVRVNSLFG